MFELVFDKLFHLDDCGVQVVLAPGVWLLSCARLKFKNHLEKESCHLSSKTITFLFLVNMTLLSSDADLGSSVILEVHCS